MSLDDNIDDFAEVLLQDQGRDDMTSSKKILIILAHPALERHSFCESLAESYKAGAELAGHEVQIISLAKMKFDPILHEGYEGNQQPEPDIQNAQEKIIWAEHLVFIYPMWMFSIPALLKGFLERTCTKGFAFNLDSKNPFKAGKLNGKSARIIQTFAMPSFIYRFFYMAHGAKAFRSALKFTGISPVKLTLLGMIEAGDESRKKYLAEIKVMGKNGG